MGRPAGPEGQAGVKRISLPGLDLRPSLEATERLAARERRRHGGPSRAPPALDGRFLEGVEVLRNGTELHLASFCLADAELRLTVSDGC